MSAKQTTGAGDRIGTPTANQRFRSRWDAQVRWATCIAAVLHAAAFALSPTWTAESYGLEDSDLVAQPLITLGPLDASSVVTADIGMSAPPVPVPVSEAASSAADGEDSDLESEDDDEAELLEAWARLSQRLRGRGPLMAQMSTVGAGSERGFVRRAVPAQDEEQAEEAEEDPDVDVEQTDPDLALPEPDSLRLERLSGVSPELAVMTTSAWVLIRNQTEIETYMRRSYTEGRLDDSVEGSVSVTLWIDRQGTVEWAEITESSGDPQLDEFALALFNEVADFRAARERGQTVSRSVTFLLNFPW